MLKIGVYYLAQCQNHIIKNWCVYYEAKFKKLTWLQAYVLGNVRVIWCNSLGDGLF